jgi:hypothetical protein
MAVTQNTYTGNGSTVLYSFTFPYLETTDIKVSVNGTATTAYTLANATTIQFNTAPANGAAIRIYRETDDSGIQSTFFAGSAIRSQDLNDNFLQTLYLSQETVNEADSATATANTALTNSNTAVSTANTASSTANTAASNAASAVSTANTAASNASTALSTANSASTAASNAVTTANTAATNASAAVTTANTASSNASSALSAANSAVSTANTASSNASAAVSTANTASTNASAAVTTANTASAAATSASTAASNAVTTANSAAATAATALSTANTAASNASAAVSTANTAASNASNAVSTANTAATNASNAVTTANTASTNASSALTAANNAVTEANDATAFGVAANANALEAVAIANAAASAVASSVLYDTVANVAAIPASPSNGDAVEVTDSTGIESFSPLAGLPAGFVGNSALSVRIIYNSTGVTWSWIQYYPNDPEGRYLAKVGGTMTGPLLGDNSTSTSIPAFAFDGDPNTGVGRTGTDELALITGGVARLTADAAGNIDVPGGLSKSGNAVVTTGDTGTVTSTMIADSTIVNADISATAAIANSKLATSGVTAGTYGSPTQIPSLTVNDKGVVTAASTNSLPAGIVTTSDTGTVTSTMIADGTVVDGDINASAGIAHSKLANITAGQVLVGNASNVPTATAVSGDATLSSSGALTLANSGVAAGTYRSVTVDAKGRATAGTNPTTFSGYGISDTSANLASVISDETGSGPLVFGNSPALTGIPTTPTATAGTNTTQIASTAFVTTALGNYQTFPSGTAMLFVQTSAPTGWTKSTTHDNKALRVVSGAASSGGSTAFTSVFASRTPSGSISNTTVTGGVGSTTLATSQIPSHIHDTALVSAANTGFGIGGSVAGINGVSYTTNNRCLTSATGGGGSHDHGLSLNAHNHGFTGTAMDFAVQYVDVIIATKN